jgi:hypothetical protein
MSDGAEDAPPRSSEWWLEWAILAFVALGILLRVARYLLHFPLWWDEAFVGVNLLRRGYLDLLRPLDYGQVCPLLFLWVELTLVRLLRFSEWSLRIFPLLCSLASVVLFRHTARRILSGAPLLLAVAIFAVSYHPIRHAADVKPYASDLLVALALLAGAIEWRRSPARSGWLWMLAATAPVAVALSYPSVFVAGGVALGLAPGVVRQARRGAWLAYGTFLAATAGTFLILYQVCTQAQAAATLPTMSQPWAAAFPPVLDPWGLACWAIATHTGSIFAYPCGGDRGASSLTLAAFLLAVVVLWRRGQRVTLALLVAPFGLAFVAAAIRRYPYGWVPHGSPARVMQYVAPSICLLTGLGVATILGWIPNPRRRLRLLGCVLAALAAVGLVPLIGDAGHPYRADHAQRARQFARSFWPDLARGAELACLRWDVPLLEWDSTNLNVAVYLCNQKIYSPARSQGAGPRWDAVSALRPLRCVLPLGDPNDQRVAAWLADMTSRYDLTRRWSIAPNMAMPGATPRPERYVVFEFVPRPSSESSPLQISFGHAIP